MKIGVDLGGTNVRVGLVDEGRIVRLVCEPCKSDRPADEVLRHLAALIGSVLTPEVERIGIGVPSVVDAARGIVYDAANIPSWREVHLKEFLEGEFGVPVAVNNDCNCFALGVCRFGEARGYDDAVCIALGTGVGAGIVIGRKLYGGSNTGAGEIGSIPYLDRDYESYCSSRFFIEHGTTGKEACARAAAGDAEALALWHEFGGHVGQLILLTLYAYDPQIIVFGGSIAQAFDFFRDAVQERLRTFPYAKSIERLRIGCSTVEQAGLLGASEL